MDLLPQDGILESLIAGQCGATAELEALCKELQNLLDHLLSARPELRATYRERLVEQDLPEKPVRQSKTAPPETTLAQWKREAERNVLKSAELIRESGQIRQRSKAMRAALRGAAPLGSKLAAETAAENSGTNRSQNGTNGKNGHGRLSKRECQVLRLIVDGKSSKEIATDLGISFKTAVTHRASI